MADDIDDTYDGLLSRTLPLRDDLVASDDALKTVVRALDIHSNYQGSTGVPL